MIASIVASIRIELLILVMFLRAKITPGKSEISNNNSYLHRPSSNTTYVDSNISQKQIKHKKIIEKSMYLTSNSKSTWKSTLRTHSQNEANQRKGMSKHRVSKSKMVSAETKKM